MWASLNRHIDIIGYKPFDFMIYIAICKKIIGTKSSDDGKILYIEMTGYGLPCSHSVEADQDAWNFEVNIMADQ